MYYRKDETDDGAKSDVTTGKKTFYDTLPGSLKTEVLVRLAEQFLKQIEMLRKKLKKNNLII